MEEGLERVETTMEAGEAPSEETPTEPTPEPSEEAKTPTLTETLEFKEALKQAQSGWDRRLHSLEIEAKKAKRDYESVQAEFQSLQKEHEEAMEKFLGDDPDAKQAYVDRKAIAEARRVVAREKTEAEAKLYEAEKLVWSVNMAKKADELNKETGIPIEDLEDCNTEVEMEAKAWHFAIKGLKEIKEKPKPATTPKVDSGISTIKGGKLTAADMETMSVEAIAEHPSTKARYK